MQKLMSGNGAIARGAVEAGLDAFPGKEHRSGRPMVCSMCAVLWNSATEFTERHDDDTITQSRRIHILQECCQRPTQISQ